MHSNDLNKQRRAVRQAEEAYYKIRKNGRMAKIVDKYRRVYEDEKRKLQNMEYEMKKCAFVLSRKDRRNDEDFQKGKSNLLYISGLSGSGKTSLAEKLEKDMGATMIELDGFEHGYDSSGSANIVNNYLKTHPRYSKDNAKVQFPKIQKYIEDYAKQHPNKKFIVEGVQLLEMDPELKNKQYIVKGTGLLKSSLQASKRDKSSLTSKLQRNLPLNKQLNNFYKQAKMEVPSEEEKRNEHVPEEYIDKAVGDCDGQECKSKRKDMRRLLEILGYIEKKGGKRNE